MKLRRAFPKSQPILLCLCLVCLISSLILLVTGKARAAQQIDSSFETEITKWLDFYISFVWDRTQDPAPREDGSIPDQDDYQLIFAIGVDFYNPNRIQRNSRTNPPQ